MTALLEVTNLRRTWGMTTAVDRISFQVQSGESFGLLGPNGAGKSTTMRMLCGLLPKTSGQVELDGRNIAEDPVTSRRQLGFVPQDLAIYPDLTAEENLRFFGSLYDLSGQLLHERVEDALTQVGLLDRRNDPAGTFSGGMKRRLNFAAATLHHPKLLILDEPTVGVDPQSRAHLLDCVRALQLRGTATIYASHYMEEVEALCDRVAIIDHGRILAIDTLSHLLQQVPRKVEVVVPGDTDPDVLGSVSDVSTIATDSGLSIQFTQAANAEASINQQLAELIHELAQRNIPLLHIRTHESSLERLFLEMTGTQLRD